jgi:protein TonB
VFDITPAGKTENIRVVYAEPEGVFERSSMKALAKWKYKPAMDDGVAMPQKNQTTRITYELEN